MSDVDQLLLNAQLREEIEPYLDESIAMLDAKRLPIDVENAFLASMLAWERAPVLPIRQWFEPEIRPPSLETLDDDQLRQELHQLIGRLYEKNIVLQYTDHLSDRQLICLIIRDILPAQEKQVGNPENTICWQCIDDDVDADIWLRYYATDRERAEWQAANSDLILPPKQKLPHPRRLPGVR